MDDTVLIEGKTYISSKRAAKISGYTQDYVGQLVRGKRVTAQKIGRSWYIQEKSFRDYISASPALVEKKFSDNRERLINGQKNQPENSIVRTAEKVSYHVASRFQKLGAFAAALLVVFGGVAFANTVAPQEISKAISGVTQGSLEAISAGATFVRDSVELAESYGGENTAIAAASGQNPIIVGAQTVAVGVYRTFHPAIQNTEDAIAALFAPRISNFAINNQTQEAPLSINLNSTTTPAESASSTLAIPLSLSIGNRPATTTQNVYYQIAGLTKEDVANQINAALSTLYLELNSLGYHSDNTQTNVEDVYDNIDLTHINGSNISNSKITNSIVSGTAINTSSIDSLDVLGTNGTSTIAGITEIQDLVVDGTQSIGGDLNIIGTTTTENLVATNSTTTNSFVMNIVTNNSTTTNATTTNAFAANIVATNATTTNFFAVNSSTTNSTSTNAFNANLVATNATTTNFYTTLLNALNETITNLAASAANIFGLVAVNSTTTNATTTNLVAFTAPIAPAFIATSSTATSTFAGGFSAGTNGLYVLQNGEVGIGTTSPSSTLTVNGSGYFGGNLTVGGNSVTLGNSSANTLTVNSGIGSSLVPNENITYDLGSPAYYWNNAYIGNLSVNNISAASTTISGTANPSFTINSANSTSDTENSSLIFFRGTVSPNAVITWNSSTKRFELNQSIFIQNQTPNLLNMPTLASRAKRGRRGDLFDIASSTGQNYFNISASGTTNTLGLTFTNATGTSATTTNLYVANVISASATSTTSTPLF